MKRGLVFLLTIPAVLLLLPGCAQVFAAIPDEEGVIEVVMTDYSFEPDAIRVRAGQTITLLLRNEGDKTHEFMVGRDVDVEGNFTEGFSVDFFAGMTPEVTGPGIVMGLPGMEMDMGAMEMGDDGGDEPGAEIAGGEFGAFQLPEMEAHGGFMVMIDPAVVAAGEATAITFTVPEDKAGAWLFGCFQERGQHFDDGMRGAFIVDGS